MFDCIRVYLYGQQDSKVDRDILCLLHPSCKGFCFFKKKEFWLKLVFRGNLLLSIHLRSRCTSRFFNGQKCLYNKLLLIHSDLS